MQLIIIIHASNVSFASINLIAEYNLFVYYRSHFKLSGESGIPLLAALYTSYVTTK